MATSEELVEIETRHQVFIEGYKSQEAKESDEDNKELLALLLLLVGSVEEDVVRNVKKKDLHKLARSLAAASNESLDAYFEGLIDRMSKLAVYEAGFEVSALSKVTKKGTSFITPKDPAAYARNLPMGHSGETVAQFLTEWKRREANKLDNLVRKAWVDGKTTEQLLRELRGTRAIKGYSKEAKARTKAQVNTLIQHTAMASKESVWMANNKTVNGYRWISILDSKTSSICRSLSRKVFKVGNGPLPPAHYSCRSYIVAELVSESIDGSIRGKSEQDPSYYAWLKTQSPSFQDDVLGPTRGKLLRDGGLTSEKFASLNLGRDFKPLTLEEMEARNPLAFEKAGIDIE